MNTMVANPSPWVLDPRDQSVANKEGFESIHEYFNWATFWMPKPEGAVLNKAGEPMSADYNEDCFAGGPQDRPQELSDTPWGNFHMCAQHNKGARCGNPWGPKDECRPDPAPTVDWDNAEGCAGCHASRTELKWSKNAPVESVMRMGWLTIPTSIQGDAQTCLDAIVKKKAENKHLYEDDAYCEPLRSLPSQAAVQGARRTGWFTSARVARRVRLRWRARPWPGCRRASAGDR